MVKKQRNESLTNARKNLNLNQPELAKELGTDSTTYCRYESLGKFPSKENQEKIIQYFKNKGINLKQGEVFSRRLYSNYQKEEPLKHEVLFNARKKLGASIEEFAKRLEISRIYYTEIENLKHLPGKEIQEKISKYLISKGFPYLPEDLFRQKSEDIYNKLEKTEWFPFNRLEKELFEDPTLKKEETDNLQYYLKKFMNKRLSQKEKDIITLYFGILNEQEHTLKEISEKTKLTKERIRQIKEKALTKLFRNDDFSHSRFYRGHNNKISSKLRKYLAEYPRINEESLGKGLITSFFKGKRI